jgi:acyl-coenzyme A synthetase/AMP-(fatty) acid ligase
MIRSFISDFEEIASKNEKRQAVIVAQTGSAWTYFKLMRAVNALGSHLTQQGNRPGDRILSLLPNSLEQLISFLAALKFGFEFCPLSPLATPDEVKHFIKTFKCATAVLPKNITPQLGQEFKAKLSKQIVLNLDIEGDLETIIDLSTKDTPTPGLKAGKLLISTSGTTSEPKAILLNGDSLWSSAMAWVEHQSIVKQEARFFNNLPMSYLGGLFNLGLIPLAAEGSVVITDAFSGVSGLKFWKDISQFQVNYLWLNPTISRTLMKLYRPDMKKSLDQLHIQSAFLGMAPIALSEKEEFENKFGLDLLENYGLSETTFISTETKNTKGPRTSGSVGGVLPWVQARFQPVGSEKSFKQEIQIKSPFLFEGYIGKNDRVDPYLTPDGYFPTGDIGNLDEFGNLALTGRTKDVIKKGGYLVVLGEIEELAKNHKAVFDAVAVPMLHDFYGETHNLCILPKDKNVPVERILNELKSLLTHTLAKFKWPDEIIVMENFPTTESGKVKKWVLPVWLKNRQGVKETIKV